MVSLLVLSLFACLDSAGNFARTQAAAANVNVAGLAVYDCFNSHDVGLPSSVRTSV